MIEYLKIEITPTHFTGMEAKELKIRIERSGKEPLFRSQIIEPDELVSFFDQIWDCAKKEVLKALKENKEKLNSKT